MIVVNKCLCRIYTYQSCDFNKRRPNHAPLTKEDSSQRLNHVTSTKECPIMRRLNYIWLHPFPTVWRNCRHSWHSSYSGVRLDSTLLPWYDIIVVTWLQSVYNMTSSTKKKWPRMNLLTLLVIFCYSYNSSYWNSNLWIHCKHAFVLIYILDPKHMLLGLTFVLYFVRLSDTNGQCIYK